MLFYISAHNLKIFSCREKHDGYFENKRNAKICIVFRSQGRQNATFVNPALMAPILIGSNNQIPLINILYIDCVMSHLVVGYVKTLTSKLASP